MRIVRPICCGLDVHKSVIVATIASTGADGVTSHEQRSFSTLNPDLARLRDWLLERGCPEACMESTGKYWIPVFNALEGHVRVVVTHPKYVRAVKGKKTDKRDSKWIADLFACDLVRTSFIPPRDIRECREIARLRHKLVRMRSNVDGTMFCHYKKVLDNYKLLRDMATTIPHPSRPSDASAPG